ncbi:hypothetical protein TVAG_417130 [Trichomonas vaginalis G3]|uniref:DUF3447 domain-containing protein n=1 Tax=Trichomonas vaginalis (strain ATCC PRA-98 / G3) TaxID=412133 RepID=A2ESH1_TRIV3|nr:protein ubiquitination [Trichomonas vaginalis G3]EAY04415.1 hypothetical protein TVAG_417130 [Trichomonas vaginalis G3]KAI5526328.1 protein ubiquitination [Trichomonas vaginalis G3]|eukprot:XP_001316638.1 hypothetical protein [Trichomonas vaginalis G3]
MRYGSDPKPVLRKKRSNKGVLKQDLQYKSIVELKLLDQLQIFQDIDDIIRNQTPENIDETFNKLKDIITIDEDLIYYMYNVLGYYTYLEDDDHKYDNLEKLLSTIKEPEYNNNFSTLFESEIPSTKIREMLRGDKIEVSKDILTNSNLKNERLLEACCLDGNVNCLNFFLDNGYSIPKDLNRCAAIGGKMEIIKILEEKGVNFNNCLECAIAGHNHEVADYLMQKYTCEPIDGQACLFYFNFKGYWFCLQNKLETRNELCLLIAKGYSHFIDYIWTTDIYKFSITDYFDKFCELRDFKNL